MQHTDTPKSAHDIVDKLVGGSGEDVLLDIQRQLVDEERTLDKTDAGAVTFEEYLAAKKKHDLELVELEESLEDARRDNDERTIESIKAETEAVRTRLGQRSRDCDGVRVEIQQLSQEQRPQYQDLLAALRENETSWPLTPEGREADARIRKLEPWLIESEQAREHMERQTQLSRGEIEKQKSSLEQQSRDFKLMREQMQRKAQEARRKNGQSPNFSVGSSDSSRTLGGHLGDGGVFCPPGS